MASTQTPKGRAVSSELIYLTKALQAPALRDAAVRLAERARDEGWSHEEYLAACLQREVAARDSHGAEGRIRAARFPSRKSVQLSGNGEGALQSRCSPRCGRVGKAAEAHPLPRVQVSRCPVGVVLP
jgi:IstB-like ATP binding protein